MKDKKKSKPQEKCRGLLAMASAGQQGIKNEGSFLKPDFPIGVEGWKLFRGWCQGKKLSQCLCCPQPSVLGSLPKVLSSHQVREEMRSRFNNFVWFGTGWNTLSLRLCLLLVLYCKLQCLLPQRDILFSKKSWKQSKRYLFFVNKITSN